jgi:peptidoglycan/LPS O-acetylase OafA/YrhL
MRKPIPSLTGLRFIAAFSVLLAHALPKIFPWPEEEVAPDIYNVLHAASAEGMSLFFVLSGFVIHYNYSEQLATQGTVGYINFFIARFARLYPLYLCCLVFDLLYEYSYSQLPDSLWVVLPFYLTLTYSWIYLPYGDHALIYQFGLMPSVAWSISTEWFFYCAYPLICFGLMRLYRIREKLYAGLAISIVATALALTASIAATELNNLAVGWFGPIADMGSHQQDSFFRWLVYFSPYSRIFEFAMGCICASIYMQISKAPPKPNEEKWGLRILYAAIAATAFLHVSLFAPGVASHIGYFVSRLSSSFGFGLPMAIIIFCCARYNSIFARFLSAPRIVLCGEASYSIYLLHLPVIYAFRWEAAPLSSSRVFIGDALRFGMTTLAIIGLSLITWSLIEVPARHWLRNFMIGPKFRSDAKAVDAGRMAVNVVKS